LFFARFDPRDNGGFDGFRAAFDLTMVPYQPVKPVGQTEAHATGYDRCFSRFLHAMLASTIKLYTGQHGMADLFSGIGQALGGLFGGLSSLASTQAGVNAVG